MAAPTGAEINDLIRPLTMVRFVGTQRLYPASQVRALLGRLFEPALTEAEIDEWMQPVPTKRQKAGTAPMVRESDLKALLAAVLADD